MYPKIISITGSHMVRYTDISENMIVEIKCFSLFLLLCERSLVFQN